MNVLNTTFQAESKGNLHGTSAAGVSNIHNTELSITAITHHHNIYSPHSPVTPLEYDEYCSALCLIAAGSDGCINHTNTSCSVPAAFNTLGSRVSGRVSQGLGSSFAFARLLARRTHSKFNTIRSPWFVSGLRTRPHIFLSRHSTRQSNCVG